MNKILCGCISKGYVNSVFNCENNGIHLIYLLNLNLKRSQSRVDYFNEYLTTS